MNRRVRQATVALSVVLLFGIAACGNEEKKDQPAASSTVVEKPSEAPAQVAEPKPVKAEPNCKGYTSKASDDWSVPQWSNPCRFTNDVFALMSDAGGFTGNGEFGGEEVPVLELQANDGPVDCGGVKLDGKTIFTSMWCGKDAGYVVIFNQSMTSTVNGSDEGVVHVFGDLLKDYSQRRLELDGKYDQFDDSNVACVSGTVMRLLVQKNTFTKEQAGVIGDLSFTDDKNPSIRATFSEGLAGTC